MPRSHEVTGFPAPTGRGCRLDRAWHRDGRKRLGELIGRDVVSEISATKDPDAASRVSQLAQALFETQ